MSETDAIGDRGFAVFCGLDVGKTAHHACALDRTGQRLHDKPLPNEEAALAEVFNRFARHGRVLVIVDQPASIGALAVAVAQSLGIEVAYLPGLAMRRIADLHPGQGKTDARVIADAARTMPDTLRRVGTDDETLAELTVLAGYDDVLGGLINEHECAARKPRFRTPAEFWHTTGTPLEAEILPTSPADGAALDGRPAPNTPAKDSHG